MWSYTSSVFEPATIRLDQLRYRMSQPKSSSSSYTWTGTVACTRVQRLNTPEVLNDAT
jgi:hypothetical protein